MFDSVTHLEIFQFQDERSNKLWGCFQAADEVWWVFWCGVEANANFKAHGKGFPSVVDVQRLKLQKLRKGYEPTTLEAVSDTWRNFEVMMTERFAWFSLGYFEAP